MIRSCSAGQTSSSSAHPRPAPPRCTPRCPAPRAGAELPEGAQVLPVRRPRRRRAPSRPGRRAQSPGVGLAPGRTTSGSSPTPRTTRCWVRARPSTSYDPDAQRRIARRGSRTPSSSPSSATRSTAPTPTGCTCGPTASSRSPTSSCLRARGRAGSAAVGRRSGATSASGRYGEQLEHLLPLFPPEQILILRYRELVDEPRDDRHRRVLTFLGIETGIRRPPMPRDNTRPFVGRTRLAPEACPTGAGGCHGGSLRTTGGLARGVQAAPAMSCTAAEWHRPELTPEQRRALLEPCCPTLDLLEQAHGSVVRRLDVRRRGAVRSRHASAALRRRAAGHAGRERRRGEPPRSTAGGRHRAARRPRRSAGHRPSGVSRSTPQSRLPADSRRRARRRSARTSSASAVARPSYRTVRGS